MSNVTDSTYDCFSFLDVQEEEYDKPTFMSRSNSNSSSSTQETVSAFVSSAGSPCMDNVVDDDDQNEFFDFCGSLEYVPVPDFQDFAILQAENTSANETMLKQSKKIKKEKVQKEVSNTQKKQKSAVVKDTWRPEEDAQLVALYAQFGPKWSQIAACMGTRNGKQIRDRYTNMLRPGITHAEWSAEEVSSLFSLCEQFGNKWCKIASYLPGRTEYQVKNKFYWEKRKQAAQSEKSDKASKKSSKSKNQEKKQLINVEEPKSFETIPMPTEQIKSDKAVDTFFGNEMNAYFMQIDQAFSDSFKEVQWYSF